MYNKFSPYKMDQSTKEMVDPHDIMIKILCRKKTGLEFHNKLYLTFKLLNMKGFAKEQKYHMIKEMESFIDFQKYYMKKYHKVPEIEVEKIQFDPYNLSQMDVYSLTGDKKSMIIKLIFEEWKKWECETEEVIKEYIKQVDEDYEEIEEIIEDVQHEIKKLIKEFVEYNDVGWCIKYLYNKQHYIKEKYDDKIEEIFED